jgi:hypothetical protein
LNFEWRDLVAEIDMDLWKDALGALPRKSFFPSLAILDSWNNDNKMVLPERDGKHDGGNHKKFGSILRSASKDDSYGHMVRDLRNTAFFDRFEKENTFQKLETAFINDKAERSRQQFQMPAYIEQKPKKTRRVTDTSGSDDYHHAGEKNGDAYQSNVHSQMGVPGAIAEQMAREIERMKERRKAAIG